MRLTYLTDQPTGLGGRLLTAVPKVEPGLTSRPPVTTTRSELVTAANRQPTDQLARTSSRMATTSGQSPAGVVRRLTFSDEDNSECASAHGDDGDISGEYMS